MADELHGRRVAILVTDGVEQVGLTQPRQAVEQAGRRRGRCRHTGEIQSMNAEFDKGYTVTVDRLVSDIRQRLRRPDPARQHCQPRPAAGQLRRGGFRTGVRGLR